MSLTDEPGPSGTNVLRVSSRIFKRNDVQQPAAVGATTPSGDQDDNSGVSKAALRMRRYREGLKQSGKFLEYREKETLHSQKYRTKRTEEQVQRDRENTKLRVQRCREKKKENGIPLNKKKILTRAGQEAVREANRERQRKCRANRSYQKTTAINKRNREKEAAKRAENSNCQQQDSPVAVTPSPGLQLTPSVSAFSGRGYHNQDTKRKAVKRAQHRMPESPTKFAAIVDAFSKRKSPRKIEALRELGILPPPARKKLLLQADLREEVATTCQQLQHSRKTTNLKKRADLCHMLLKVNRDHRSKGDGKHRSLTCIRKELNLSWKYLQKCQSLEWDADRKRRCDALSDERKEVIKNFFNRGDVSQDDPSPATVSAKTNEPTRFLEKTLKEVHNQFLQESSTKISFSKFASLRPRRTKTASHTKFNTCCCEYCENIKLKQKALNSALISRGHHDKVLGTKFDIANLTCCTEHPARKMHHKKCINRICDECGVSRVRAKIQDALHEHGDTITKWQAWKLERQTFHDRTGQETSSQRRICKDEEGTLSELVDSLLKDLETFALHLANFQWQQKQMDDLRTNLPDKWLLIIMDYGENFTCGYQDEAQGAHWTRQQVTCHPCVTFYHCPDDGEITKETFFFISDDLKHDCHGVQHFQIQVTQELLQRGMTFNKVVHFSDGCPNQYKGRTSFVDLSFALEDTGISTEKHFFGSRHGKGPGDQEIGTVKRLARLAVLRRQCIIATARDLYDYGCANLTLPQDPNQHVHKRRSFRFVAQGEIKRQRPDRITDVKSVPGTRSLHCVRGQAPYMISRRERSCFCDLCVKDEEGCPNQDFCGPWAEFNMRVNRRRQNGPVQHTETLVPADPPAEDEPLPPAEEDEPLPPAEEDDPIPPAEEDEPLPPAEEDDPIPPAEEDEPLPPAEEDKPLLNTDGVSAEVNTCVIVRYPDRCYPGVVTEKLEGGLYRVNFLRPHLRKKKTFVYPETQDVQIVSKDMIVKSNVDLLPCTSSFREWRVEGFEL